MNFIDILTGEIFTLQYLIDGIIDLHHINFIKTDLRPENLVFLFRDNHNIITQSKYHFKVLYDFLTKLLHENIKSLMQNRIPKSWIIGWRKLAFQDGIRLPSNRYIKQCYRPTIIESFQSQRRIDSY